MKEKILCFEHGILQDIKTNKGGEIMAVAKKIMSVEYMCSWCGTKTTRSSTMGRPLPGTCPRKGKTRDGKAKPHTWVVNRKY